MTFYYIFFNGVIHVNALICLYRASVLANSRLISINYIRIMHWIIAHLSRKIGLQSRSDAYM